VAGKKEGDRARKDCQPTQPPNPARGRHPRGTAVAFAIAQQIIRQAALPTSAPGAAVPRARVPALDIFPRCASAHAEGHGTFDCVQSRSSGGHQSVFSFRCTVKSRHIHLQTVVFRPLDPSPCYFRGNSREAAPPLFCRRTPDADLPPCI